MIFTNGFSKYKHVYILKSKSKAFPIFKSFKVLVKNQTGRTIKRLVNDGGGEYVNEEFKSYLDSTGILMDVTALYTPQQNPISERGNCTTTERAQCLLIEAGLPKNFWAKVVNTSVYIENRCPEASINHVTPHEIWYGFSPKLDHLQVFGCTAYRLIPKKFRGSKFSPTSQRCLLLGYQERMNKYRLYDLSSKRVIYSHDVLFDESNFPFISPVVSPSINRDLLTEDSEPDECLSEPGPATTTVVPDISVSPVSDESLDPITVPEIVVPSTSDLPSSPPSESVVPSSPIISPESPTIYDPPVSLGKRKTFWTPKDTSPRPSKEVSLTIDPRNIITRRTRNVNAAISLDTPKTYKQAMKSPT